MANKILIDVQGGVVQAVFSNNPDIEVCLIDWDSIGDGDTGLITSDNYGVMTVTNQELDKKMEEANALVRENIEMDIEQRR